jgi:hypothetical protein
MNSIDNKIEHSIVGRLQIVRSRYRPSHFESVLSFLDAGVAGRRAVAEMS